MAPTSRTQLRKTKKAAPASATTSKVSKPSSRPPSSSINHSKKPKKALHKTTNASSSSTSSSALSSSLKRSDISKSKALQEALLSSLDEAPLESIGLFNVERRAREKQVAVKAQKAEEKKKSEDEARNLNQQLLQQLESLGGLSV